MERWSPKADVKRLQHGFAAIGAEPVWSLYLPVTCILWKEKYICRFLLSMICQVSVAHHSYLRAFDGRLSVVRKPAPSNLIGLLIHMLVSLIVNSKSSDHPKLLPIT
jgi:hypothetical protein